MESKSSGAAGPSTSKTRRFSHTTTLARRLGDTDVDDKAMQPRIEAVRIAESLQVAPGDHQCVLKGILGPIDVAQDAMCDREEAVAANADQVDKRRLVTVPCRLDEIAITCAPRSSRPEGARPNPMVESRGLAFILLGRLPSV